MDTNPLQATQRSSSATMVSVRMGGVWPNEPKAVSTIVRQSTMLLTWFLMDADSYVVVLLSVIWRAARCLHMEIELPSLASEQIS